MVAHVAQIQLPPEGGGEGGEEMGYRGGKKVETEGKTINQEAWSLQDWKPNSLGPNHCLPLLAPGPHRLHFPHVLESLSSERRGGEGWGGGGHGEVSVWPRQEAVFSAAGHICAVWGEQLSQASGMCLGSREARTWKRGWWPLIQGPSPAPAMVGGGQSGTWRF